MEQNTLDLKQTVNLPRTDFPMKANLPQAEPKLLARWEAEDLYQQIRAACRKYAEKYVNLQREDFKRLGVFGRWEDPYLTMSAHYQSVIAGAFVEFLDRGYIYKGLKPVHWCPHDRTALAEAEVEYK